MTSIHDSARSFAAPVSATSSSTTPRRSASGGTSRNTTEVAELSRRDLIEQRRGVGADVAPDLPDLEQRSRGSSPGRTNARPAARSTRARRSAALPGLAPRRSVQEERDRRLQIRARLVGRRRLALRARRPERRAGAEEIAERHQPLEEAEALAERVDEFALRLGEAARARARSRRGGHDLTGRRERLLHARGERGGGTGGSRAGCGSRRGARGSALARGARSSGGPSPAPRSQSAKSGVSVGAARSGAIGSSQRRTRPVQQPDRLGQPLRSDGRARDRRLRRARAPSRRATASRTPAAVGAARAPEPSISITGFSRHEASASSARPRSHPCARVSSACCARRRAAIAPARARPGAFDAPGGHRGDRHGGVGGCVGRGTPARRAAAPSWPTDAVPRRCAHAALDRERSPRRFHRAGRPLVEAPTRRARTQPGHPGRAMARRRSPLQQGTTSHTDSALTRRGCDGRIDRFGRRGRGIGCAGASPRRRRIPPPGWCARDRQGC